MRYSNNSPSSPAVALFTMVLGDTSSLAGADAVTGTDIDFAMNCAEPLFAANPPTPPTAPAENAASCTTGRAAASSASSASGRLTYFGAYNWLTNEIGRPDTSESCTFVQSSPVVLSTMAQPSSTGCPLAFSISR